MNKNDSLKDHLERVIRDGLRERDSQIQVEVQRSTLGWVRLRVISQLFADLDEEGRETLVNQALAALDLNLTMYPFAGYALLTPDEAQRQPVVQTGPLPLWSDILMEPEPDQEAESLLPVQPLTVTFYSIKGGVGRSTALAITAGLLSERGLRVVLVDFDLEAPGLTAELRTVEQEARYGVVDYIYQRWLLPDAQEPLLEDCIRRVGRPGSELFLIPAGAYDANYIHRLADFDIAGFYRRDQNPVRQLFEDIKSKLSPDVILIDARTGFNNLGAVASLDLADVVVLCFSPNQQSYQGLQWVLEALRKKRRSIGKPEVRFVLTPLPRVQSEILDIMLTETENLINTYWGGDDLPQELWTLVNYQPDIPLRQDIMQDTLNREQNLSPVRYEPYLGLAANIAAYLPGPTRLPLVRRSNLRDPVLVEFQQWISEQPVEPSKAEGIPADQLAHIFQRTANFPAFLSERTVLIRGAKGTGKSLLFRLFTESSIQARELAAQSSNLEAVDFIRVHGPQSPQGDLTLTSADFAHFEEQAGQEQWSRLWSVYSLLKLVDKDNLASLSPMLQTGITPLLQSTASHEDTLLWLIEIVCSPLSGAIIEDALRTINQQLTKTRHKAWLFYDGLDLGFGSTPQDLQRRRRAVQGLLSWWLELGNALDNLKAKIFIREDLWQSLGSFPNRTHYIGRDLVLKWKEEDLWRFLLRQIIEFSPTFTQYLAQLTITTDTLDSTEIASLRKALDPLWGEQQSGQRVYRWVLNRIVDSQENWFPRSLILLVVKALEIENRKGHLESERILQSDSLKEAVREVSMERVAALQEEYPELVSASRALDGKRSPLSKETLAEIWRDSEDLDALIETFILAGIFERRKTADWENKPRYGVAELYLHGLGMHRTGRP